jgi:hypothetical protein
MFHQFVKCRLMRKKLTVAGLEVNSSIRQRMVRELTSLTVIRLSVGEFSSVQTAGLKVEAWIRSAILICLRSTMCRKNLGNQVVIHAPFAAGGRSFAEISKGPCLIRTGWILCSWGRMPPKG